MGTVENPNTWAPSMNTKDCTQGFCSLSCPQWCYLVFPPPPPFAFLHNHDESQSGSNFSPLVIAIIGILASAFLLASYYALITKYCGNSVSTRADNNQHSHESMEEEDRNLDPSHHEPWLMSRNGLDEGVIKAITLVKYKKGDGLVGSSMCSICLIEILEDDTLRLLPKCSHAFHVACIDTWLKSHSNCPLCRANIVSTFAHPPSPPQFVVDVANQPHDHQNQLGNGETRSSEEGREMGLLEQVSANSPKGPFRAFSDLGDIGLRDITVTDAGDHQGSVGGQIMRRSISMDHPCETHLSVSEILRFDRREDFRVENCQVHDQYPKEATSESSKASITGSTNAKFLFCKLGRVRNAVIHV